MKCGIKQQLLPLGYVQFCMFPSAPADLQIQTYNKIIYRVNYINEFGVLTAMTMGRTIFLDVTSRSLI
jgi:hypothetical protein